MNEDIQSKRDLGYMASTQRKHWLFANGNIIKEKRLMSFRSTLKELESQSVDLSKYPIPSDAEYLSAMDFYFKEIIEICRKYQFPAYVSCTAVTYFDRFFLNPSFNLINIDAMCMKDTAIYLASKAEQSLLSGIDQLTNFTKTPSQQVIDNELVLMDGINFHLKIWSPLRSLRTFLSDFKIIYKNEKGNALNQKIEQRLFQQAQHLIQDSFICDVAFIYSPSQISLSCLLLVLSSPDLPKATKQEIESLQKMAVKYFNSRFAANANGEKLKETTKVIQAMIIEGIQRTNSEKFKKMASSGNAKIYKLSTLYFNLKNGGIQKQKKKKITLTFSNKKRKGTNMSAPNPKRQKIN